MFKRKTEAFVEDITLLHRFLSDNGSENPLDRENTPNIVVVEDDIFLGQAILKFLSGFKNFKIKLFSSPADCLDCLTSEYKLEMGPFCLLTDITFDDSSIDGLSLIDLLRDKGLNFESIVMTGFASIENAISATKKGVYHYLTKPFELDDLRDIIIKVFVEKLKISTFDELLVKKAPRWENRRITFGPNSNQHNIEPPKEHDYFCGMIGRSKIMKNIFERIEKVANSDSTILISGPSGTGKELVANAIHQLSKRELSPLISVNCGAIPSELLESELFGHLRGAFTGAISDRKGRFELANKGTIFLDEIGDMPLLLQVKLLRVLQDRKIEPIGGDKFLKIDTRIITATHKNLEQLVTEGDFREDLYYRLNVIPIVIPSLSERREDIPLLISYFLSKFVSANGGNKIEFDRDAIDILMNYDWPGNIRELENLIERLVILKGGNVVRAKDLPAKLLRGVSVVGPNNFGINLPDEGIHLKSLLGQIEESLISQALQRTRGNKNKASKLLKMNRTTLIEKLKKQTLSLQN